MDIETSKRIKAYQKALPDLRERVLAVALLLAMSLSMLTSASFAWLTISRRPEVSGVSTTVAANGNLEIALATGKEYTPKEPSESQIGDSSVSQDVTKANITWGNLINLSDPRYGLDNLVLRPAELNESSLMINPLNGASYLGDGRIEKLNSDYGFATWSPETELFMIPTYGEDGNNLDQWGVRAISSTTTEAVGWPGRVKEKRDIAVEANLRAGAAYIVITQNSNYMNTLSTIMGTYMTANLNRGQGDANLENPTVNQKDIQNLRDLFRDMVEAFELQFEAITQLVNYQLFLLNNSEEGQTPYTPITAADLMSKYPSETDLKNKLDKRIELSTMILSGKSYDSLKTAVSDYNKLKAGYADLVVLADQGSVKWADSGLADIVNNLMNTGACTLDGTPVSSIGASNATGYLSGTHEAKITNGVLFDFEYLNGSHCDVRKMKVTASIRRKGITIPNQSITVNISTSAPVPDLFTQDLTYSDTLNKGAKGVSIAEDTYGLALDLWVRTNAAGSYLTLEGNVLTKAREVQVMSKNRTAEDVPVYTVSRTETSTSTDDEGNEVTEDIPMTYELYPEKIVQQTENPKYYVAAPDNEKWFLTSGHAEFTLNEGETPNLKVDTVYDVIGYEGENRIWEDAEAWKDPSPLGLSLDSTTQGSGSCYVYYADTPEDQARSLELLKSMKVAFVNASGKLLAKAEMDTDQVYAENGRYTVPLKLRNDGKSIYIGDDPITGEAIYGIMALEKNVATRITAIVYLDGKQLTNEHVLSASDIQGKLNIQFGSSVTMSHADSEDLFNATRTVSAAVDKTTHSFDDYKANGTPMRSRVTVNVSGDQPTKVTGFFIRSISSSQGSREDLMTFEKQPDGSWVADYDFTAPGEYILRTVELDGQPYDLATRPEVKIEGFSVRSLSMDKGDGKHVDILTDNSVASVGLTLTFASDKVEAMPATVQGRFLRQDGNAVTVNFQYDTDGKWIGVATFATSGEYTMQYLVLDGQYVELDSGLRKTASVTLGMKAAIYTTSPVTFPYLPDELEDNEKNLYMQVQILDNNGDPMEGITDARLYYAMKGSSVPERGMVADLTWDGREYYTCTFQSKIGEFIFSHITTGESRITHADPSPVFRILSPKPPTFNRGNSSAQQYVAPNAAQKGILELILNDCTVGTVVADVTRIKGNNRTEYELEGTYSDFVGEDKWTFTIPQDVGDGASDGVWTITRLRLWDVYDENSNLYTEDAPLIFDLTGEDRVSSKVISTVNVKFTEDLSQDFTGNSMLNPYTIGSDKYLHVDFTDYEGKAITNDNGTLVIGNVQLALEYVSGTSGSYGHYTSSDLTNTTTGAKVTINLSPDTGGTYQGIRFRQTQDAQLLFAGKYKTTLSYQINGVPITDPLVATEKNSRPKENMPVFTVSSNNPTVTVSSVSPTGSAKNIYAGTRSSDGSVDNGSTISVDANRKIDSYNAVVYIYAGDSITYNVYTPTVKLKLSGMPDSGFTADMVFANDSDSSHAVTYTFTANNQEKENSIGYGENGGWYVISETEPKIFPAGKQTVSSMNVTYGDLTLTVALSNPVTINQPQYPPYVDFVVNDSVLSTPSRIYGTPQADGTFTVTLPTVAYADKNEAQTLSSLPTDLSTLTPTTTTSKYAQYSGGRINGTWTKYDVTTKVYTAEASSKTWKARHQLVGWASGTNTFAPGQTFTFTGTTTLKAVVDTSYTHSENTETVTYKRTVITIVTTSESGKSYSRPRGYTNAAPPNKAGDSGWVAQN